MDKINTRCFLDYSRKNDISLWQRAIIFIILFTIVFFTCKLLYNYKIDQNIKKILDIEYNCNRGIRG